MRHVAIRLPKITVGPSSTLQSEIEKNSKGDRCGDLIKQAVSEIKKELTVHSIFPNPGKEALNMEYSVAQETNLDLFLVDASGRVLKSESITINGNGTYTMKTNEVKAGIYLFVVTDNDGFKEVHSWVKK